MLLLYATVTKFLPSPAASLMQLEYEVLTADAEELSLHSVTLHGLGGVGKSSIALSYAEEKFPERAYDVILWVCGEKDASLRQSFTDIAMRLRLPGANSQSHDENAILVQDWFQATGRP